MASAFRPRMIAESGLSRMRRFNRTSRRRQPFRRLQALLWPIAATLTIAACGSHTTSTSVPPPASGPGAPAIGKPAPSFGLRSADGALVNLEDYRGKIVLLNFWATWCGPCKEELPAIDAVQRRLGDRGFAALAVDFRDQDDEVVAFASRVRVSFPLLQDHLGVTASAYRLLGVPTSFLLDGNGDIRAIHAGPYTEKALAAAVSSLLDGEHR